MCWLSLGLAGLLVGFGTARRRTDADSTETIVPLPPPQPPEPESEREPQQEPQPSKPRAHARPGSRTLAFLLCGLILLGFSFGLFLRVRRSPEQPAIDGRAYLYVNEPSVDATLRLILTGGNRFTADPPTRYEVLVVGGADKPVRWALVLSGDARLRHSVGTTTSAGVTAVATRVASPPFGGQPEDVQVFHGETRGGQLSGAGDVAFVAGRFWRPVAQIAEARRTLALPQIGRVVPQFTSADSPLPIGVDGSWYVPRTFEAIVDLGRRPLEHRVDLVAPNLGDQAVYRWSSPISVRPILGVTDTDQERVEEMVVFLLGVLSAAGLEVLIIAVQRSVLRSG